LAEARERAGLHPGAAGEKETSSDDPHTRSRNRPVWLPGLCPSPAAGPRQAHAQSDQWDALYDRIIRLEHEIKDMKSGGGGAIPLNPAATSGGGAVEDQLRQVLVMLDEIRRTQRALEMRLEQLEGRAPDTTGSIFQPQQQAYQESESSFDFSQYQTRELAELSAEQDVTVQVYRDYEPQAFSQPQASSHAAACSAH
jgi:hypothetical protein